MQVCACVLICACVCVHVSVFERERRTERGGVGVGVKNHAGVGKSVDLLRVCAWVCMSGCDCVRV